VIINQIDKSDKVELVIVHNFDLFGWALIPNEANSPLVVDTDAVLSSTVAM
jgi:hypothetical protein